MEGDQSHRENRADTGTRSGGKGRLREGAVLGDGVRIGLWEVTSEQRPVEGGWEGVSHADFPGKSILGRRKPLLKA